jgi:hypothetical protein
MSFTSVFISLCHDIFVDYLFPVRYLSNLCGNFVLLILWWFMKAFVTFGGVIVSVLAIRVQYSHQIKLFIIIDLLSLSVAYCK